MPDPAARARPTIDYGDRLRMGIIVPSGNVVAEPQIHAMLPAGVSALFTRLALRGSSEAELQRMEAGVEDAARLLADARVDRIVFHCTAVTTFSPSSGPAIRERIGGATGIEGLVTSDALEAAFQALGTRRVVLLTPYIEAVHRREIAFLEHLGLHVAGEASLGIDTNDEMARLSPDTLADWVLKHRHPDADAYFLSCTALRSAELIASLEDRLGRPVLTSNQVMVWHALREAGIKAADRWGQLMRL
ncbi:maleate isomerase [Faunimonas pinastri]|uniref:Maleate isomerase n=1 Tax=Faunimonas pinastri TaxID=1855383 RepID=A0A1H9ERV7_9HYPH|nr:arylmalonate decarboxylase [Faunimonas pinastri]SEQ28486.1 maleate isomerase [Faunimonas pinastri]